ncbi:hypothetical protein pb186bvf_016775 [Paramecium bursaria]
MNQYVTTVLLAIVALILLFWSFIGALIAIIFFPITLPVGLIIYYSPINRYIKNKYHKVYDYIFYQSERPRKFLWQKLYDNLATLYPQDKQECFQIFRWTSMNYGFALLTDKGVFLNNLSDKQQEEQYCLQLYNKLLEKPGNFKGKKLLEVGSGRGGGLHYYKENLQLGQCYGVDFSRRQIQFCQLNYKGIQGLNFIQGDAEQLDQLNLPKDFDYVVNVESSHCYANFEQFIVQVTNHLRSGGIFAITDFREIEFLPQWEEQLKSTGLELLLREDITLSVTHAMKLDEKRKQQWISKNVNFLLRPFFRKFAGFQGSRIFKDFQSRKSVYMIYVLQKV